MQGCPCSWALPSLDSSPQQLCLQQELEFMWPFNFLISSQQPTRMFYPLLRICYMIINTISWTAVSRINTAQISRITMKRQTEAFSCSQKLFHVLLVLHWGQCLCASQLMLVSLWICLWAMQTSVWHFWQKTEAIRSQKEVQQQQKTCMKGK